MVGIGMMIAEAFLFSHGILGIGGVVAFVLGASMLIDVESPEFRIAPALIAGIAVGSALCLLVIVRTALSARRRKVVSGAEDMIGARGVVQDWCDGKGHVFVHGERWSASGDRDLDSNQAVRVVALSGLTVEVERVETKED
jgi:membrane-bound serine protease (ClpP class)